MIHVFQINEELSGFEELKLEENKVLFELLDPHKILLFVDEHTEKVWIWEGQNTSPRMKFIAARLAPNLRDREGFGFRISAADGGDEPAAFKVLVGLV